MSRRRPSPADFGLPDDAGKAIALPRMPPGARTATVPRRGNANRTELRFASEVLEPLRRAGMVARYDFEAIKLMIAASTPADAEADRPAIPAAYYCPDWLVVGDGRPQCVEIKGHWREAARVRIKVAAWLYPWIAFTAVRHEGGRWKYERFGDGPHLI